jgi:hypothetical protein
MKGVVGARAKAAAAAVLALGGEAEAEELRAAGGTGAEKAAALSKSGPERWAYLLLHRRRFFLRPPARGRFFWVASMERTWEPFTSAAGECGGCVRKITDELAIF